MEPVSVTTALLPPQPGVSQRSGRYASGSPLPVTTRLFSWLLVLIFLLVAPIALAAPTTPTEDFTDNLDGTVTHRITGLTWMRCAMGMTWTGTTCTGTASTYTWAQATKLTANFAGKSDWRLPSIAELNTIVELEAWNPAINRDVFPNTPLSEFWSGSPLSNPSTHAWLVYFYNSGGSYFFPTGEAFGVRLVRGGESFDPMTPYTPTSDFVDNRDGTVTHIKTGLTWKRCAEGQVWVGTTCSGVASTYDWTTAVSLTSSSAGYNDWRIPSVDQLKTIVEYRNFNPSVNQEVFPNVSSSNNEPAGFYWSGSSNSGDVTQARVVDFYRGNDNARSQRNSYPVRLVRNGQFFSSLGFPDVTKASLNTSFTSSALRVLGNSALPITVDGGSYSISGGIYVTAPGTISPNDSVTVRATSSGNLSTTTRVTLTIGNISGVFKVITASLADTQAPSVPKSISAIATGASEITISWLPANDNVGVTEYQLYRDRVLLKKTGSVTAFVDRGLNPATTYLYQVAACDASRNCSLQSSEAIATTYKNHLSQTTTPSTSFTDNLDGTVTHRSTGLTWMRCPIGMDWTGFTCAGTASTLSWGEAKALTVTYAGRSDWRLPRVAELNAIVERAAFNPAINKVMFPGVRNSWFWSSSLFALDANLAWYLDFSIGSAAVYSQTAPANILLVRGGRLLDQLTPSNASTDYYDNHDGTITHLSTGLMWKRCAEGQIWDGASCVGTKVAYDWSAAATLTSNSASHSDWRLPSMNELLSIVGYEKNDFIVNGEVFPTWLEEIWSDSLVAESLDRAWGFYFVLGRPSTQHYLKEGHGVLLVRGGQFFGPWGFTTQTKVATNTPVTSNALKIFGLYGTGGPITITGGQYSINGSAFTSSAGTINPNDSLTVRLTSAPTPGTTTTATLTIGTISGDFSVTTAVDAQPPVAPSSLSATSTTSPGSTGIKLTWPASTDNTGVTHYRLYRNGALLAVVSSPTTSYTDTQLANSNQFSYTVQTCDAAGNCSTLSSTASTTRTGTINIAPQLSTGAGHSAGIKSDGSLFTWGFNDAGQLGIGISGAPSTSPQRPSASVGSVYTSVATGTSHTLALKLDGTLWTWGGNASGQLGDGTTTSHNIPTQIGTGYMAVAAGSSHSLAIKLDGTLWSWGNNGTGQLGDGTSNSTTTPIQIGSGFYTVSAGTSHTVAIKTDGTLWAWGSNNFGQLGDATGNDRYAPQLIGSGFTAVAAGAFHTLALKNDGTLWAWGQNTNGQLGDNTSQNRYAPVQIGSGYSVIPGTLAAGNAHSLALKADGSLWAWGSNASGQLGDGTTTDSTTPKAINPATAFTTIAANGNHSLAMKPDGTVWSWGANNTGQLGDATLASRLTSVLVLNETVDGALDLIPEVTNNIPADKLPSFLVQVAKAASVTSTVKYNQDDLNKSGHVYIVAYLRPDSPLLLPSVLPTSKNTDSSLTKDTTTCPAAIAGTVPAVLTRGGWKQTTCTTPTEPLYSGTLSTSNNTFSMYDAAIFDQTKDNGLFCVSYAGSITTSAKGLIRSVVSGVDANLNQCPPVQIGAPADTTAPSIPLNITATPAGPGQVNLSWSAATDNVGVAHYNIYRGTSLIATVGNVTSYTDTSPQASTVYSYSVMACDIALNCSGQSTNAQTNTPAQPNVILSPGWNLVGNGGSTPMNVATLFADSSKVYSLWKWVRSGNTPGISYPTWAMYAPGQADGGAAYAASKGYETLTSIQSAEGFWVNAKAAMSVPMTAPAWILSSTFQPGQSNALSSGWSLIATGEANTASGFNKAIGATPPAPGQISNNLTTLWAWENSTGRWYFYAPTLEAAGTLQGYVSDKGYLDFGSLTLTPTAGVWVNR